MSAPVSTRSRRGAAAVLSVSLAAAGLAALAPGAGAVSGSITCTADELGTVSMVLDTDAPARMAPGQTAQVTVTATAVIPGASAQAAWNNGTREFAGTLVADAAFGSTPLGVEHIIPRTSLGDQGTSAQDVSFVARSAPLAYTAPATPGAVEVLAVELAGSLELYATAGGTTSTPAALTCRVPNGKAPVIDTIAVVATSTTTFTLDRTASEYGQDVTATARVTTSSGTPDGDVAFSVDGLATKARVGKDGVATLLLPDAGPGAHHVTATFVPRDATAYDASTSAPLAWTVTKARTRMRVPVTGKTTRAVTRVGVRAKGVFDTVPTGKVRIKVKRIGKRGTWVKVRSLDDAGAARAGFGRLTKGRYQVVVVYRGDTHHRYLKKTKKFRVTRG